MINFFDFSQSHIWLGEKIRVALRCPGYWKFFAGSIATEISALRSIEHKIWGKENLENWSTKMSISKISKSRKSPKMVKSGFIWSAIPHWSFFHSMRGLKNHFEKFLVKNSIFAIFSWSIFSNFLKVIFGWGIKLGQRSAIQAAANFLLVRLRPKLALYNQ